MFEKKACKGHGICPYQQEIAKPRHESANGKLKSSTTIFFTAFSNLNNILIQLRSDFSFDLF